MISTEILFIYKKEIFFLRITRQSHAIIAMNKRAQQIIAILSHQYPNTWLSSNGSYIFHPNIFVFNQFYINKSDNIEKNHYFFLITGITYLYN